MHIGSVPRNRFWQVRQNTSHQTINFDEGCRKVKKLRRYTAEEGERFGAVYCWFLQRGAEKSHMDLSFILFVKLDI